jgi:hypothetical protein
VWGALWEHSLHCPGYVVGRVDSKALEFLENLFGCPIPEQHVPVV